MKEITFALLALSSALFATAAKSEQDKSSPVFQAKSDKIGDCQYQCYREPVVVKTNSGRMMLLLHFV